MPNILNPKSQRLDKVRVDFFNTEFKRLIAQKGLRIDWEQRQPCPCFVSTQDYSFDLNGINDEFGQVEVNPDCPVCSGGGLVKHSQQEIKAIVTGINSDYDTNDFGTVLLPEIKVTLLPEHLPSFGDRFTLKDSAMTRQEVLDTNDRVVSGATQRHVLSYPAATRTLELASGNVEKTILSVYYTDANGVTVGELAEEVGGVKQWLYNAQSNSLQIQQLNTPPLGAKISVTYYAHPTFTVFGQPYAIRDTFLRIKNVETATSMPVQAYAKLEKK